MERHDRKNVHEQADGINHYLTLSSRRSKQAQYMEREDALCRLQPSIIAHENEILTYTFTISTAPHTIAHSAVILYSYELDYTYIIWCTSKMCAHIFFFFQAEDGIRDDLVTGVQTCALPI